MHELTCPKCQTAAKFNLDDKILLCQLCSASFTLDRETGQKDLFSDHYIVPNMLDGAAIKETVNEWLRRLHHSPELVEKEFVLTDLRGFSIPYWVTSMDAHTVWKGLVKREGRNFLKNSTGAEFLMESGEFRRTYRWAISARKNLCEIWGMTRLHVPKEAVIVDWDGFPLDSTFSRGRLDAEKKTGKDNQAKSVYDHREFFDYKFSNGLPILGIQVSEEESLRRAKNHVQQYHYLLSQLNLDYLIDCRTELEIIGVQLIHLPFWQAVYQYRPTSALKHFMKPVQKNVLIEGNSRGVINGELAITYNDKVYVNGLVCLGAAVIFFLSGVMIHPAFYAVSIFSVIVGAASAYMAASRSKIKASTRIDPKQMIARAWMNDSSAEQTIST